MQLQKESLKNIQAFAGFEPLTSAITVQRSTLESSRFHRFIKNQFYDLLPVGLLA